MSRCRTRMSTVTFFFTDTATTETYTLSLHDALPITVPQIKHLGPLLVVWGAAMFMLVFIRDLGSSLMYFGGFLALLYVATNRMSFVVIGLGMFALGAWFFASTVSHVQDRIEIRNNPFNPEWV